MGYTSEVNNQIVIGLLKYHGIRRIVVSPGATNVSFVASIQQDEYFTIYSSVDERSAAYIACGLAEQSGEPIVLSCTGATASRNYLPGMTEAYYRKLPVLAITSTMPIYRVGQNIPQIIDRSTILNDVAKLSVHIPLVKDQEDEWICNLRVNQALLELRHGLPGPVHMNVETLQSGTFDVNKLVQVRPIDRITCINDTIMPKLEAKKIAIFIGEHSQMSNDYIECVDEFCEKYNAIVIGDHTSNYKGKYFIPTSLVYNQKNKDVRFDNLDIVIHIGNHSGAYLQFSSNSVWRVSLDGKLVDTFNSLRYVFEMNEMDFFKFYNNKITNIDTSFYEEMKDEYNQLYNSITNLPFSNIWIAKQLSSKIPEKSILHLGILNSLRAWNFFYIPKELPVYSNTGGFGIDGCLSTVIGEALAKPNYNIYGVMGDLAFFYDINSLGNRHISKNIRILVINNGLGQEFKNYEHRASQFEELTNPYIAAEGHFGKKSKRLIKNYVQELGFEYLSASNKEEFESNMNKFLLPQVLDYPIVYEVFTESKDETEALRIMLNLRKRSLINEGIKKIFDVMK